MATSDVYYIAGRPLTIGDKDVQVGDTITPKYIEQIPLLESFISAGYIYRVHKADGYDRLPPHVYAARVSKKEALEAIAGDPGVTAAIDANQAIGDASEASVLSRLQADMAVEHARLRKNHKPTQAEKDAAVAIETPVVPDVPAGDTATGETPQAASTEAPKKEEVK